MPILNDLVQQFNEQLVATLFSKSERFVGAKLYAICEQMVTPQTADYPALVDLAGNGTYVGIDDTQSLIIYHRKQGLRIGLDTAPTYGDRAQNDLNTYSMVMIAFFNRQKLRMESDELALYIQRNLPALVNKNFRYLSISVNSVILNNSQVFRSEYQKVQYFLKPEHALVAINYTIEGVPQVACLNRCPE